MSDWYRINPRELFFPHLAGFILITFLLVPNELVAQFGKSLGRKDTLKEKKPNTAPVGKPAANSGNEKTTQGTKVEIVNANSLEYDESLGIDAKRLIGDVIFKHGGATMYADSAHFYDAKNTLEAYGNIRIHQSDTLHLYGDYLNYDGNRRHAFVSGKNLLLTDRQMTLFTQSIDFETSSGIAWYSQPGRIVNGSNTLTSKRGKYYSRSKDFYFSGDVLLVNPDYRMTCDTLRHNTSTEISYFLSPTNIVGKKESMYCENGWYNRKKEATFLTGNARLNSLNQSIFGDTVFFDDTQSKGWARGKVELRDTVEHIQVLGQKAWYFEDTDSSVVSGDALMIQAFKQDTLFLHADTLIAVMDSSTTQMNDTSISQGNTKNPSARPQTTRRLRAYHRVRFFKPDFQGICDSLVYNDKDSLLRMFGLPIIWNETSQLLSDYVQVRMAEGDIMGMTMRRQSFILTISDSLHPDQISGDSVHVFFEKNKLSSMLVSGQGKSLYYLRDDDKKISGANRADASRILIKMGEDKIQAIRFLDKPNATLFPPDDIPSGEAHLKGYFLLNAQRPISGADVMQWKPLPLEFVKQFSNPAASSASKRKIPGRK